MALTKIGASIVLDGEKQYKDAIANVNRSMSTLRSEMKLAKSEFEGQVNSIEALKKEHEILSKEQDAQITKIKTLNGALENAKKEYGENSKQVSDWQIKVNNANVELNNLNKALATNEKYLDEAEKSTDGCATSIDKYGKEVVDAEKETKSFGDTAKSAGKVAVAAFAAAATAAVGIVESTKELRQDLSKLDANAKQSGVGIDAARDSLRDLNRISNETDSNIEALSNLMKTGFSGDNLKRAVDSLSGAVLQFPDTLKIESLADSLQETLATGGATGQFGELLERLGVDLENFNYGLAECTSEAEKQNYALQALSEQGLSDVTNAYLESNKALVDEADAQYELQMAMAEIGEKLAPVVAEGMKMVAEFASDAGDKIGSFVKGGLDLLIDAFQFIMDNAPIIEKGLLGIASGFVAFKVTSAIKALKDIVSAAGSAKAAMAGLNAVMAANPAMAVAMAVGALTTAVIALCSTSDDAETKTSKFTDAIDAQIDSTRALREQIEEEKNKREEIKNETLAGVEAYQKMTDRLYELSNQESRTSEELSEMKIIVANLNKAFPDLGLSIDETTGAINKQKTAVDALVESMKQQAMYNIAQDDVERVQSTYYDAQKKLIEVKKAIADGESELAKQRLQYKQQLMDIGYSEESAWDIAKDSNKEAIDKIEALKAEMKSLTDVIAECDGEYAAIQETLTTVNEALEDTTKVTGESAETCEEYVTRMCEKMKESLNDYYGDYEEKLDENLEELEEQLEEKEKLLDKQYKADKKALDKQQKEELETLEDRYSAQVDLAKDASSRELAEARAAHNEKLALINAEYTEKIKLVDEERYAKIKALQDQIDGINKIIEEEEKSAEARAEAKEREKLEEALANATTYEEYQEAQQAIADFDEEIRQKKADAEREAAIKALENQIDAYNKEYDGYVETLEKELSAEEENQEKLQEIVEEGIAEKLQAEEKRINAELEQEKEKLADIQELQDEQLAEKYETLKKTLAKENSLALEAEREKNKELLEEYQGYIDERLAVAKEAYAKIYNEDPLSKYELDSLQNDTSSGYFANGPTTNNSTTNNNSFQVSVTDGATAQYMVNKVMVALAEGW